MASYGALHNPRGLTTSAGENVIELSQLDIAAIAWLTLCWAGYNFYTDFLGRAKGNLIGTMAKQRRAWLARMLGRENRMLDLQIVRSLTRTSTFFASTSILVLAGLITECRDPSSGSQSGCRSTVQTTRPRAF